MTKELKLSRERSKVSPTLTPRRAKSVSYEDFKTEMDAKNRAYAFILSNNLFEPFKAFCLRHRRNNHHKDAVDYLYNLAKEK